MWSRNDAARILLALDAAGCMMTAVATAAVPALLRPVDPTLRSRWPVSAALVGTALLLARGARSPHPSGADLRTAAVINGAWVTACLVMLPRRRGNRLALALLTATAGLDAAAGAAQWMLRQGGGR